MAGRSSDRARARGVTLAAVLAVAIAGALAGTAPGVATAEVDADARAPVDSLEQLGPVLDWSPVRGAHEQALWRREHSPLFRPGAAVTSEAGLRRAKIRDAAAVRAILTDFVDLAADRGKIGRLRDVDDMERTLARYDDVIVGAAEAGGPAYPLVRHLVELRAASLQRWRTRSEDDVEVLTRLAELDASSPLFDAIATDPFVAQFVREGGPLKEADRVPALLSESAETIALVLSVLAPPDQESLRRAARAGLVAAKRRGAEIPNYAAVSAALERVSE